MRSMSKLALLLSAGAPLMLVSPAAFADPLSAPPAAPPAVQTSPTASDSAPAMPPAADGLVKVHIATKELVILEHRSGPTAPWTAGCETPCDARLPAADEYRIVGTGVNESEPFVLTAPKGDEVTVHVSPGLKKRERLGEILTISGAVVTIGAVAIGIAAADPSRTFNASGTTDNYNWNVIAVGTAVAVVGITTGILGGAWWYDNSQTRVAGDVQADPPARGGLEPRYQTGMRMSAPNIATYSATLFSTSF